ncbi:MAG: hypothetical protein RMJ06_06690 [Nitrososphaerota archaeon]|nr:hypothetical protein [Nitrososphaerota archaeon]
MRGYALLLLGVLLLSTGAGLYMAQSAFSMLPRVYVETPAGTVIPLHATLGSYYSFKNVIIKAWVKLEGCSNAPGISVFYKLLMDDYIIEDWREVSPRELTFDDILVCGKNVSFSFKIPYNVFAGELMDYNKSEAKFTVIVAVTERGKNPKDYGDYGVVAGVFKVADMMAKIKEGMERDQQALREARSYGSKAATQYMIENYFAKYAKMYSGGNQAYLTAYYLARSSTSVDPNTVVGKDPYTGKQVTFGEVCSQQQGAFGPEWVCKALGGTGKVTIPMPGSKDYLPINVYRGAYYIEELGITAYVAERRTYTFPIGGGVYAAVAYYTYVIPGSTERTTTSVTIATFTAPKKWWEDPRLAERTITTTVCDLKRDASGHYYCAARREVVLVVRTEALGWRYFNTYGVATKTPYKTTVVTKTLYNNVISTMTGTPAPPGAFLSSVTFGVPYVNTKELTWTMGVLLFLGMFLVTLNAISRAGGSRRR